MSVRDQAPWLEQPFLLGAGTVNVVLGCLGGVWTEGEMNGKGQFSVLPHCKCGDF